MCVGWIVGWWLRLHAPGWQYGGWGIFGLGLVGLPKAALDYVVNETLLGVLQISKHR